MATVRRGSARPPLWSRGLPAHPRRESGRLRAEAFTRNGIGVQCYAPKGLLSNKQRYDKHRKKLSADISKLIRNGTGLVKVLGTTLLKRWFFMIPEHDDKDLIAFGNTKALEVRAKSLPSIDPYFEIQVHDDSAFPAAQTACWGDPMLSCRWIGLSRTVSLSRTMPVRTIRWFRLSMKS